MARLCAQTLPTGKTCARFALKGEHWCPAHLHPDRRQQTELYRLIVENIPRMDMLAIATLLLATLSSLRIHGITPLYAQAIFAAATLRLEDLVSAFEAPINHAESDSYKSTLNRMK